jgi:hypothetical protein
MASIEKSCSVCTADLNGQKRVKDKTGTYFCPPCWEARTNIFGDDDAPPQPPLPEPAALRQAAAKTVSAPPTPSPVRSGPVASTSTNPSPRIQPQAKPAPEENVGLKKCGYLCVGIAAVAIFDLWPVYEASHGVDKIWLSFKGMLIGWMLLCIMIVAMLPESVGVVWKPPAGGQLSDAARARMKIVGGTAVAAAVLLTVLTWLYIRNQGYETKF